jgi:transposase
VEAAQQRRDWRQVRRILVDETSARRGHRYVTTVVDADTRELLFLAEGREGDALAPSWPNCGQLRAHGG